MRNITKEIFFKIFNQNTDLERLELNGFSSIRISSYEAFIYATITGSGYLDNLVMPFTPDGMGCHIGLLHREGAQTRAGLG